MTEKDRITILGLGNILMRDEGFGVHFIRWFSERYSLPENVKIVEGGTMGYALLGPISLSRYLIVIDVLKLDDEPGSVYRFTREDMEAHLPPPTSAHEVTFQDVLFKAELIDECPETVFLCIIPENYADMDLEMSPRLKDRFPAMEELLLKELLLHDIRLETNIQRL
jgi:hydrogenase maturation protease